MWDLPGPGLEPVSPALAGEFLTTAPPGKSLPMSFVPVSEAVNPAIGSDSTRQVGTLMNSLPSNLNGPQLLPLNPTVCQVSSFCPSPKQ